MTEPINNVSLGGLTFNSNVAKGREVEKGKFLIEFHSGEKLSYPQQPETYEYYDAAGVKISKDKVAGLPKEVLNAKPGSGLWGGITKKVVTPKVTQKIDTGAILHDDAYFEISNVMGATFESSKGLVSHVTLDNCEDTKVDLAKNYSRYFGDDVKINGGANNEVELDHKDKANINGKEVKGWGTAAQKDYEE